MSDYSDLIERLREADGPDRELDCHLGYVANLDLGDGVNWRDKMDRLGMEYCLGAATSHQNVWSHELPHYTASVDSALSLVERVLPGWRVSSLHTIDADAPASSQHAYCRSEICPRHGDDEGWKIGRVYGLSKSLPLAVLIALLTALQHQGE